MRQDKSLCLLCLTSKGKSWVPWELLRFSSACNKCKKKVCSETERQLMHPIAVGWELTKSMSITQGRCQSVSPGLLACPVPIVCVFFWGTLEYLILLSIFLLPHFFLPLPMSSSSGWKMLVFSTASLCCPESSKEDERKERGWPTLCIKLSTSPNISASRSTIRVGVVTCNI